MQCLNKILRLKFIFIFFLCVVVLSGKGQTVFAQSEKEPSVNEMLSFSDEDFEETEISRRKNYENYLTIKTEDGRRYQFDIELALDREEQANGLMYRQSLDKDAGMLFVFYSSIPRTFWMKNTFIPLDILFVEKNGRIQHIHSMAEPQDESFITSGKPAYAVLELHGGITDELGISEGDYIHHTAFKNRNLN